MKDILPNLYRPTSTAIAPRHLQNRKFLVFSLLLFAVLIIPIETALAQREVIFDAPNQTYNYSPVMTVHENQMMKADANLTSTGPVIPQPFVEFYEFTDGDWKLTQTIQLKANPRYIQDLDIWGNYAVLSARNPFDTDFVLYLFSKDSNGQWQVTDELRESVNVPEGSTDKLFYYHDVEVNSNSVAWGNLDYAYLNATSSASQTVNGILGEVKVLGIQNGKVNESNVIYSQKFSEVSSNGLSLETHCGGQLELTDKYFVYMQDYRYSTADNSEQAISMTSISLINNNRSDGRLGRIRHGDRPVIFQDILSINGVATNGKKLSIAGDYLAAAGLSDPNKSDEVYIYDLTKAGDKTGLEIQKLTSSLRDDRYGDALDFRYDSDLFKYFLAVGASGLNTASPVNDGKVYLYEQSERLTEWKMESIGTLETKTNHLALGYEVHLAKSGALARSLIPSGGIQTDTGGGSTFTFVNGTRYHYFYFTPPPIELSNYRLEDDGINLNWKDATDSQTTVGITSENYNYEYVVRDLNNNELQKNTRTDFKDDTNVQPGTFKSYQIVSQNGFGQSPAIYASGYVPHEGEIKGTVTLPSDNSASGSAGTGVGGTPVWLRPPQSEQTFLSFPATPSADNYVSTTIDEFPEQFTLEFWIRPSNTTAANGNYVFSYSTPDVDKTLLVGVLNNKLNIWVAGQRMGDFSTVNANVWQHFAISFDGTELKVYKNGTLDQASTVSSTIDIADNGILILGHDQDCFGGCLDATQAYQGDMDELRIWKVARTAEQIGYLYNAVPAIPSVSATSASSTYDDLLLNYRFDENYPQDRANRVLYDYTSTLTSTSTTTSISTRPRSNPAYVNGALSFNSENVAGRLDLQALSQENSGSYSLPDIQPNGRTFVVEPDKTGGRVFEPESINVTLSNSEKTRSGVDFIDRSSFGIAGRIYFEYQGTQIPAPNVEVAVKNPIQGSEFLTLETFKTDANGVFSGTLESGTYVLEPVYADHTFSQRTQQISLPADVGDSIFFVNTTTRTLNGKFVGGSCDLNVGGADLRIAFQQFEENLSTSLVDGVHRFTVSGIPALINDSVAVTITDLDDDQLVLEKLVQGEGGFLNAEQFVYVDSADVEANFFYRAPTTLEVSLRPNLQPIECIGENVYLLSEEDEVKLTISAFEMYNGERCDIDTATVRIFDAISDRPDSLMYLSSSDTVDFTYTLRAGNPNVVGGGPRPYQKTLQIDFDVPGGRTVSKIIYAIVQGSTPRIGQPFISTSPSNIPLFILRDPPGDQSFSYIEEGKTISRNISIKDGASGSIGISLTLGDKNDTPVYAEGELGLGFEGADENSVELTMTTRRRISTSTDDGVLPGKMSDVFVGTNVNILYGLTDVLTYNREICEATLTQQITWFPDRISSTYTTSYGQIVNSTIPELESLIDLETDPVRLDSLNAAITDWKRLKEYNDYLSQYTVSESSVRNEEFDAGAGALERSTTITKSETDAYYFTTTFDARLEVGWNATIPIPFIGIVTAASGAFFGKLGYQYTESGSTTNEETYEVGYVLDDDDVGDNFLVEVTTNLVDDPKFESDREEFRTLAVDLDNTPLTNTTPSFRLIGGQSSAPWEGLPSVPRDSSQIVVSPRRQANVGAEEEAVFTLNVGNLSQSGEPRDMEVRVLPASNPDGLVISSGSGNLTAARGIFLEDVPANESVTITFTARKGPNAYNYEDIAIVALSPYEYDATAGSQRLSDTTYFSVSFEAPCEPVAVFRPEEGWVVNSSSNDSLRVIVDEYDKSAIQEVSLQLRNLPTGSWRTLRTIPGEALNDKYTALYVDVSTLEDGSYDFRAVTQCQGGQVYSDVFTGFIDREAPEPLDQPLPEDGVLGPEDGVALVFDEDVDPLTITTDNLIITNAATGDTLDMSFRNNERRIVLNVNVNDPALENQLLQASARGIADQYGNVISPIKWEFVVNRSPIRWELPRIIEYLQAGENFTFDARIQNAGGQTTKFEFSRLPNWLEVLTDRDSVLAGESMFISFRVSDPAALTVGNVYEETITLKTALGNEPLEIILEVGCAAPDWTVDANAFSHSMQLQAGVYAEQFSVTSPNDLVAAYVGDELRGVAEVYKLVPDDEYVVYLDVYSNQAQGEEVSFKIWDASECEILDISEMFTFEANTEIGSVTALQTLSIGEISYLQIPLQPGTNWVSFNLTQSDMSLNTLIRDVGLTDGSILSSHDGRFAQFAALKAGKGRSNNWSRACFTN